MSVYSRVAATAKNWGAGERTAVAFLLCGAVVFGVACWHVPEVRRELIPKAVMIGLTLDAMTVLYVLIMVTLRRRATALPFSFAFYFWAWLALPFAVLAPTTDGPATLWTHKLIDLAAIGAIQFTFHQALGAVRDAFPPLRSPEASPRRPAPKSRRSRRVGSSVRST